MRINSSFQIQGFARDVSRTLVSTAFTSAGGRLLQHAGKFTASTPHLFGATVVGGMLFNMCEGPALLRRLGLPRVSGARTPLQACLGLAVEAGLSCLLGTLLLSAAQLASPSVAAGLAAVTLGVGTVGLAYAVVEAFVVLLTSDFVAAAPAAPAAEPPHQP